MFTPALPSSSVICASMPGVFLCSTQMRCTPERGIETGDTVRIYNDHGSVTLKAVVTKGIQKDTVWVPHGFIWDEFDEGFAQSLTRHCPDPVTSNNNLNDWICQVEKVGGAA